MKDKALKLALEALEKYQTKRQDFDRFADEIIAIKEALAQPSDSVEQEPRCVAVIEVLGDNWKLEYLSLPVGKHRLYAQQYNYTAPPKREWVSLKNEKIMEIHDTYYRRMGSLEFAKLLEAKLKELNT